MSPIYVQHVYFVLHHLRVTLCYLVMIVQPSQVAAIRYNHTRFQKVQTRYQSELNYSERIHKNLNINPNHPISPPRSFSTPLQYYDEIVQSNRRFEGDKLLIVQVYNLNNA